MIWTIHKWLPDYLVPGDLPFIGVAPREQRGTYTMSNAWFPGIAMALRYLYWSCTSLVHTYPSGGDLSSTSVLKSNDMIGSTTSFATLTATCFCPRRAVLFSTEFVFLLCSRGRGAGVKMTINGIINAHKKHILIKLTYQDGVFWNHELVWIHEYMNWVGYYNSQSKVLRAFWGHWHFAIHIHK